MADLSSVVEEKVKFKDGKKWKPRWCVIRKPSPVADRLQVQLYKCIKDAVKGDNPKSDFYLEVFYGLETGFSYDKENNVLAIICQKQVTVFAFDSRETLIKFEIKIRNAIGEENQFPVYLKRVPPNSKLPLEKMRLHIHGQKFCLTKHVPPRILASWNISDLKRFGKVEGKFVFEGGSRCGKVAGVHILNSDQTDDIEEIVQLASQGKTISCRKANKRRSQNCDYLDPLTKSPSMYRGHAFYYNNDHHGRGWRHSISTATDTSWSSNYNSQLMSIENLQMEKRAMQIYDVPPREVRKVQRIQSPKNNRNDFARENSVHSVPKNHIDSATHLHESSTSLNISVLEGNPCCLGVTSSVSASAPALCGYGAYSQFSDKHKSISSSVPDRIDEEVDHQEALESLQREEIDLQREISLLDELLKGCKRDDSSKHGKAKRDKCKPPPIPRKSPKICKRPDNIPIPCTQPHHIQMDNSLLSPNLFAKLRKIPSNSKLSAPLPYVNLDKYDLGDVDNSHIHMSSQRSTLDSGNWSAPCDRQGRKFSGHKSTYDKENNNRLHHQSRNGTSQFLHGKSCSESSLQTKVPVQEENIYENTPGQRNSSPPPPALPPKGPALLSKIHESTNNANSSKSKEEPPPVPPHKNRKSRNQDITFNYQYVAHGVRPVARRNDQIIGPTDSYLLMSSFTKEDGCSPSTHEVKLPTRKCTGKLGQDQSPGAAYMEMGSFEEEKNDTSEQETAPPVGKRQHYVRSLSTSAVLDDIDNSSISSRSQSCASSNSSLIREENYLLMSNFQKKSSSLQVQSSPQKIQTNIDKILAVRPDSNSANASFSSVSSENSEPAAIPFPNLINFQRHATIGITGTKFSRASFNNTSNSGASPSIDKSSSNESSGRKFLTRLIRRNSGNRKSMSQSQENLLQSSSSESCLERTLNQDSSKNAVMNKMLSQSSESSSSSCGQYQVKKDTNPLEFTERNRSSSFPNRASFLEMTPKSSDKDHSSHDTVRDSFYSELSLDDEMQLLDCDNSFDGSDSSSLNEAGKQKTQSFYMGPCESTGSENGEDDCMVSEKEAQKLLYSKRHIKVKRTSPDSSVSTVLQVEQSKYQGNLSDSSSKTDDEKLLDLLTRKTRKDVFSKELPEKCSNITSYTDAKRRLSLPTDAAKNKSPKEEASAIAKLVTALTPFVPPKAKNFPCPLSPVPESMVLSRVNDVTSLPSTSSSTFSKDLAGRKKIDPSSQKEFAKANLRIHTIPTVEEEESVWVHRDSLGSQDAKATTDTEKSNEQEEKFRALVVEVDDERDQDDTISLSSIDSSLTSNDEGLRSSPASTLLRPRSGKEYKMVERRRTTNDSLSSSPAQTPQSPSGGSVFTFETSCSPSQTSVFSPERESPSVPLAKLYERISPPRSYVNVDMTPPSSPLCSTSMSLPPEQLEPQLNYAEIDLTPVPSRSMRKSRKASQKSLKLSNTIEYAMIDMEATMAIQRAGREHAMSREDSLRRSESRKLSLTREHKLSIDETTASMNDEVTPSLVEEPSPQRDEHRVESSTPEGAVGNAILLPERKDDTSSSSESESED